MNKKLLFIFNPASGKGMIRTHLLDILDCFVQQGYEVTTYPTQKAGDALEKVPVEADRYDLIVCCGGDGTLDEVVTGMMHCQSQTPIGYIPAGSTNDFARSLGIPKTPLEAAQLAVTGTPFACDVGIFNDDNFVYVAAFGMFTEVSYMTNQKMKNRFGHAAYMMELAKRLYDIPSYEMEIRVQDEIIKDRFIYGMVSNSVSVGGLKNMTGEGVQLDDGKFEVTLIRMPDTPKQLNEIITPLMMQEPDDSPYIYRWRTDHVECYSEEPVPWTLDGEFGGDQTSVIIENQKQRIRFVC